MEAAVAGPVRSMTGFASEDREVAGGRLLAVAIKAVNHRHLDLSVRLPGGMDAAEPMVRAAVRGAVRRGHVEVTVTLGKAAGGAAAAAGVLLDEALLLSYQTAWKRAAQVTGLQDAPELAALLRLPGVLTLGAEPARPQDVEGLLEGTLEGLLATALSRALGQFEEARLAEGGALAAALLASMQTIAALAGEAAALRSGVAAAEFARLRTRMRALLDGAEVSEERLLTEAALLAGRGDIEEELVRLRTHVDRFSALLHAGGEVGRPLEFLLQEMNREANTALSKTGASAGEAGLRLTEIGLAVKAELERAREQVQNLE